MFDVRARVVVVERRFSPSGGGRTDVRCEGAGGGGRTSVFPRQEGAGPTFDVRARVVVVERRFSPVRRGQDRRSTPWPTTRPSWSSATGSAGATASVPPATASLPR